LTASIEGVGLIWTVVAPLAGAVVLFALGARSARVVALLAALATGAAVVFVIPPVLWHGALRYRLGGWGAPLGVDLYLDGLSALMLLTAAAVGVGATLYALAFRTEAEPRGGTPPDATFWTLWLLLWAALNGLFLAADVFNLYVTLELLTLSAVGLVATAGGPARAAALQYLLWALAGSLAYLLGVALLYGAHGTVDIAHLSIRVSDDALGRAAGLLMLAGLALKTALFPLHFWLPPAHAAAPPPVSALLSALVVKAAFYAVLRLWVTVFAGLPLMHTGQVLGALGTLAVVWGSVQAFRQERLKLLVAYSTVAQIGYLFLCFALADGWSAAMYLAVSHACAKAAMFLGVGSIARALGHDRVDGLGAVSERLPVTLFAVGVAGVGLMGLPPTGGFIGKWLLLQAALAAGQWWVAATVLGGGILAACYVFRIIAGCFSEAPNAGGARVPLRTELPSLALALLALVLGLIAPLLLGLLGAGAPFGTAAAGPR
jgi:formate hydrogenlyase subunit 3/multisubunit Na+/H+ antiporter MnhD subunit